MFPIILLMSEGMRHAISKLISNFIRRAPTVKGVGQRA
jgi:hypothetical protein